MISERIRQISAPNNSSEYQLLNTASRQMTDALSGLGKDAELARKRYVEDPYNIAKKSNTELFQHAINTSTDKAQLEELYKQAGSIDGPVDLGAIGTTSESRNKNLIKAELDADKENYRRNDLDRNFSLNEDKFGLDKEKALVQSKHYANQDAIAIKRLNNETKKLNQGGYWTDLTTNTIHKASSVSEAQALQAQSNNAYNSLQKLSDALSADETVSQKDAKAELNSVLNPDGSINILKAKNLSSKHNSNTGKTKNIKSKQRNTIMKSITSRLSDGGELSAFNHALASKGISIEDLTNEQLVTLDRQLGSESDFLLFDALSSRDVRQSLSKALSTDGKRPPKKDKVKTAIEKLHLPI
jgi:hypothetical protein